jgi:hypothetical protein
MKFKHQSYHSKIAIGLCSLPISFLLKNVPKPHYPQITLKYFYQHRAAAVFQTSSNVIAAAVA